MALKPLHDRVLVKRTESEEKTAGGLIIPDSAKEKPSEGEVVACGDGARALAGADGSFEVVGLDTETAGTDWTLELAADGVRGNAVNPGVIVTEVHKRAGMDDDKYKVKPSK